MPVIVKPLPQATDDLVEPWFSRAKDSDASELSLRLRSERRGEEGEGDDEPDCPKDHGAPPSNI